MSEHMVPKVVVSNLGVARTHLKNAYAAIKEIQLSHDPDIRYKYGFNTLELYAVICTNALKGIDKVIGSRKIPQPRELKYEVRPNSDQERDSKQV
jgi:hypothetical protein